MKTYLYWIIEFDGDRYALQSDLIGRELLLKNNEVYDKKLNLRTKGGYKIESRTHGNCKLDFFLNVAVATHTIRISNDTGILAEYTESLDHLAPKWLQETSKTENPESTENKGEPGKLKKVFSAISWLMISLVVWGLLFSWQTAPVLILVLLFHEAGHYIVMRIAGYRNMKLMMLPPFGAVVYGEKPESPDWERFCMYMAGPLPGIIIAFLFVRIFGYPPSESFTREIILMLFGLNYFNLLPVQPLDGGRIIEIMFLHKSPILQIIITGTGALGLGIMSFIYQDILLGLLVLLMLGLLLPRIRQQFKREEVSNQIESVTTAKASWYQRTAAAFIYFGTWAVAIAALIR
ncbi:site-2 protease family protein [Spirochaeta dissipatitropha]